MRRTKTEAGVSLRAPVERVVVTGSDGVIAALSAAADDLREAGVIAELVFERRDDWAKEVSSPGDLSVDVALAKVVDTPKS